ncbi:ROK family transcriptional regulator [Streptomyces bathyalis]|uniref:ROK family transcriptional regulator n=1 Tax=Streptomyces bathyalis TaxID=2710756 RepID=A0A7T1WTG3_9ACTN|nr:ROK family transcriptional regulator [Streptomyces bathyalis]QPP10208.1 ROK family transcriptional regulator [Streptomyces bathyalis]
MGRPRPQVPSPSLISVLDLLRSTGGITRPELAQRTGLTRKVVVQRVEELIACGLAEDGGMARSSGGRAPREVRFRANGGHLLIAELAATSVTVGLADLSGAILDEAAADVDARSGPDATLERVEQLFDGMLTKRSADSPPVWGIGIGIPGPVATATGRPIGAVSAPGWADYPVRDRLAARYDVPVWVENEVNLMALGEVRAGLAKGRDDVLFVKLGSGIGGAIIAGGTLQRGSGGFAGEIGHTVVTTEVTEPCWCGQSGCLTQIAGARALGNQGEQAAASGRSPILAAIRAEGRRIGVREVLTAASAGDPTSHQLLSHAGELIGRTASVVVNVVNPSVIVVGGGLFSIDDPLMDAFRTTVRAGSLPSAAEDLSVTVSALGNAAGLIGAAYLVVDELLSPRLLAVWSEYGTPQGLADLIHQGG